MNFLKFTALKKCFRTMKVYKMTYLLNDTLIKNRYVKASSFIQARSKLRKHINLMRTIYDMYYCKLLSYTPLSVDISTSIKAWKGNNER